MKELRIAGTKKAPSISYQNGHFSIEGCSIPEDSKKFFKPILSFFEDGNNYQAKNYLIEIKFEYCDTSSLKWILNILMVIQKNISPHNSEVRWYYEADDAEMMELGEFVQQRLEIPFKLVEVA